MNGWGEQPLRVALLHNEVAPGARADDLDTLVQAQAIAGALASLGHAVETVACTLNFGEVRRRLLETECDLVFNLVESLAGTDRLGFLAAGLLDALGLPYTGCRTPALLHTIDKRLTKRRLHELCLPAAPGYILADLQAEGCLPYAAEFPATYLVKTLAEQGSFGIDGGAIRDCQNSEELARHLVDRETRLGRACLAEPFIAGREFNVALLARGTGNAAEAGTPQVLPIGEIDFSGLRPGEPHIVDYQAKWVEDSHQYQNTPRQFGISECDRPLVARLAELSLACWRAFDLAGYARVDFRVDEQGCPWILEVNANPCLAPEAGFAGIAAEAGIEYQEVIGRIVAAAWAGCADGAWKPRA